jgi:hypothetical protein
MLTAPPLESHQFYPHPPPQVCELAAAAEASSEHPLARAVLEFSEARLASPEPGGDKHIVGWSFDVCADSRGCSTAGNSSHAQAPNTPPKAQQQRAFTAAFSLEDDHSPASSTPAQQYSSSSSHHQHPSGSSSSRSHSPVCTAGGSGGIGSGGGSLQLVEVSLSSPQAGDTAAGSSGHHAFGPDRHSHGGGNSSSSFLSSRQHKHWSAAAGGGYYRRSSAPNSPRHTHHISSSSTGVQHHQHSQHEPHGVHAGLGVRVRESDGGGRGSQAGGVPWTPGRLRHLLSNGLLRVSEVQVRGECVCGGGGRRGLLEGG